MTFLDIYDFEIDGNRVGMFKIPAAIGVPTTWKEIAYDRNDESLVPLNDTKRNIILSTVNIDWSRQIVEGLTVEDLDKNAILKAREQFKKKNENKSIAEEIDKIMILNEGSFIPQTVDTLIINEGYVPPYYRNPFLAQAMVNLNMIDTAGIGIRRSFEKLRERFFPMPDYDLTEENRVKVTIYGKIIDEKYSKLLLENTDLSLVEVMLLDRVQKNVVITKEQSDLLRKNKLIEGRYPHLYVSKEISEITNDKAQYIKNRGLSNDMYKEKILQYIKTYGKATIVQF